MTDFYELLDDACKRGDLDTIKNLHNNDQQNGNIDILNTVIRLGIQYRRLEVIKYAHECDTNVSNTVDVIRQCAIHCNAEIIKYICENATDIDRNYYQALILIIGAQNGNIDAVTYLCENSEAVNISGYIALQHAVSNGRIDIVKCLCKNGVNINTDNDFALTTAAMHGHVEVVKYLLQNGANINECDNTLMFFVKVDGEYTHVQNNLDGKKYELFPEILDELHNFNNKITRTKAAIKI